MEKVQPIRDRKQIEAIKKILKSSNMRDYCIFTLGINGGGLRIHELLRLTLGHVLDEQGKLRDRVMIRDKTGKVKEFWLNEAAAKAIKEFLSQRSWSSLDEPLFPSRKKKDGNLVAVNRDQAYKVINSAARAAGIQEKVGTETLRKTWGYHAYLAGFPLKAIQKIFNHSSEKKTRDYLGIKEEEPARINLNL